MAKMVYMPLTGQPEVQNAATPSDTSFCCELYSDESARALCVLAGGVDGVRQKRSR